MLSNVSFKGYLGIPERESCAKVRTKYVSTNDITKIGIVGDYTAIQYYDYDNKGTRTLKTCNIG